MVKNIGVLVPKNNTMTLDAFVKFVLELHKDEWDKLKVKECLANHGGFEFPKDIEDLVDMYGWYLKSDDYSFNLLARNRVNFDVAIVEISKDVTERD